jgi:GNAT superfamily N-acetyltransferase
MEAWRHAMIHTVRTQSANAHFQALVRLLDQDLQGRYPHLQAEFDQHTILESLDTVLVAYDDDTPAGCGCFTVYDAEVMEIKRMFVHPAYRGRGIAQRILRELEAWATVLGYQVALLATGIKQPEAIRLYEQSGYRQVERYGIYQDMPQRVCFRKDLTAPSLPR